MALAWVNRLPDGVWQVRWREGTHGPQRAKRFRRKVDADAFAAETGTRLRDGTYVSPVDGKTTVAKFWEQWCATRQWKSPATRERYTSAWVHHIEPGIGRNSIAQVRHSDLQGLITRSELSPGGQGLIKAVLSAMFRQAVRDRLIAMSPAVDLETAKADADPPRPLSGEEAALLLAMCSDLERPWVLLGLGTGVRISESLAVRTETIDFFKRELTVKDQARTPNAGAVELAPTKTRKPRTVPLTPELVEELARHIERTIPLVDGRRDGYLFPAAGGGLLRRGHATARFAAIASRAGLEGVTWHNLRDTAATGMLRSGLNPAKAAQILGNTPAVLLGRYAGVVPDDDELARHALSQITSRAVAE